VRSSEIWPELASLDTSEVLGKGKAVPSKDHVPIYLEQGSKKTFASAVEWPGWSRWGKGDDEAIVALLQAGPRYAALMDSAGLQFKAPTEVAQLHITERVEGGATTDFGAPEAPHSSDSQVVDQSDVSRFEAILDASWQALAQAVDGAGGKELRKGPRGGGRELASIVDHVTAAHESYLKTLGWKPKGNDMGPLDQRIERLRRATSDGLAAGAAGELPAEGPRGGKRWSPRYFVRRAAWHIVDHVWEIEDRVS
jgi:hypothetical protein